LVSFAAPAYADGPLAGGSPSATDSAA